jgi:hypothetical protein
MSRTSRTPLRVHPAFAIGIIALCAVLIFWLFRPIHQLIAEIYAIIIVVLAFRYWPPMTRWFIGMPVPHRVIFIALLGAMLVGHLTVKGRTWFPFVSWEIFSIARQDDPVSCREFIATTDDGKSVRLIVEQLFPSIVQFNPPDDNDSSAMTRLVDALAKTYDQQHPTDLVRRVDLMQFSVKLHPSSAESDHSPTCELLKSYDVSSDRSN